MIRRIHVDEGTNGMRAPAGQRARHLIGNPRHKRMRAIAIVKRLAAADDAAHNKENVVGAIALTGDHMVALKSDWSALQCGQCALERMFAQCIGAWPADGHPTYGHCDAHFDGLQGTTDAGVASLALGPT